MILPLPPFQTIFTPENTPAGTVVIADGNKIDYVVRVDTKKGKITKYREPLRPDKYRKRILTETVYTKQIEVIHGPILD